MFLVCECVVVRVRVIYRLVTRYVYVLVFVCVVRLRMCLIVMLIIVISVSCLLCRIV